MRYRAGYKYQLVDSYCCKTKIRGYVAKTDYLSLDEEGNLYIRKGYAWDGCSGIAIDTKNNMCGGLEHDAKYQLIRNGFIPEQHRKTIDQEFKERLRKDGMNFFRAWYYYRAVRMFGGKFVKPENKNPIKEAP